MGFTENKPLNNKLKKMEDNSTKRSKNFSKQELEVLVEEVVSRRSWIM